MENTLSVYEWNGKSIKSSDTRNKPFDSLSVEKSFNWNYSFITEKGKLYKSLCRMPKGLILYGYINNHWFILQANKGCGCLFMAVSWSIIKVNDYPVLEKHQLRSELLYEAFKWFLSKWKQKQVTTETFMQTNQNFWYEKHTVMFHL